MFVAPFILQQESILTVFDLVDAPPGISEKESKLIVSPSRPPPSHNPLIVRSSARAFNREFNEKYDLEWSEIKKRLMDSV